MPRTKYTPQQKLKTQDEIVELQSKMRALYIAVWGLDAIAQDSMIDCEWTTPLLALAGEVDSMTGALAKGVAND